MKDATLKQAGKVLEVIGQKEIPGKQLQELIGSGLLSDLLDADIGAIDRNEFRKICGLVSKMEQKSKIIPIDRTVPFDPVVLLGEGWKIVEQDERSLALTEIDLAKVHLESCLKPGERWIEGEEKLKRLKKDGRIRLDAKIFQMLWENQHMIPESWEEKINGNICYIVFDGTVLHGPGGCRYVLLLWRDGGSWSWCCNWLGFDWGGVFLSAVLTSI